MVEDASRTPATPERLPVEGGASADTLDQAFARLEGAVSRLERAATLRPAGDGDAVILRRENDALRGKVGDALRQLDSVLAELTSEGEGS